MIQEPTRNEALGKQKAIGVGLIAFGLFLSYGIYSESHKFDASNRLGERLEEYAVDHDNFAAANYYHHSRNNPSWLKMLVLGVGAFGCFVIAARKLTAT